MRLKMIACEVFYREICLAVALSPHTVDMEFTTKNAHDQSALLRAEIQRRIDETAEHSYDAILLGYGLCGNGTVGLRVRHTPLVLPRAHDCCTLFLGSRQAFKDHFGGNPSQPFSSLGYMERGEGYLYSSELRTMLGLDRSFDDYIALYGEENARYIWETLNPQLQLGQKETSVVFIEMPETEHLGWGKRFEERAVADGKKFTCLRGDARLFQNLINGVWDPREFLVVQAGETIEGVYDWDEICRAVKVREA